MVEIWKVFRPGESLYEVSNLGNIRNEKGLMAPAVNKDGYRQCLLRIKGKRMNILLHRAVAEMFLTNKENFPIVNHKDGDKLNNAVSNLEWCSSKNNHSHAVDTGLIKLRGEDNIRSIFTKKDVRVIRTKLKSGTSTRKLAAELDCSRSAIQHIKKGRSWQWL